jgi:hypothetical protein
MYSWMWGSNDQKGKETQNLPEDLQKEIYEEYLRVKNKYPDWVPIFVESKTVTLTKNKYLTRKKIPFKAFAEIVRQYCVISTPNGTQPMDPHTPLLFVANETLIPPEDEMSKVYDIHKKPDGFLHIVVSHEPGWRAPTFTHMTEKQEVVSA